MAWGACGPGQLLQGPCPPFSAAVGGASKSLISPFPWQGPEGSGPQISLCSVRKQTQSMRTGSRHHRSSAAFGFEIHCCPGAGLGGPTDTPTATELENGGAGAASAPHRSPHALLGYSQEACREMGRKRSPWAAPQNPSQSARAPSVNAVSLGS